MAKRTSPVLLLLYQLISEQVCRCTEYLLDLRNPFSLTSIKFGRKKKLYSGIPIWLKFKNLNNTIYPLMHCQMRQRIRRTRLSAPAKVRCVLTLCLYILSNSFPLIYLPTVWKNMQFVTGLNQCLKSEMLLLELKGKN